ncbi:MAG: hypothetical protein WCL23_03565 [Candidatus Moraniibacteriota bacterium]
MFMRNGHGQHYPFWRKGITGAEILAHVRIDQERVDFTLNGKVATLEQAIDQNDDACFTMKPAENDRIIETDLTVNGKTMRVCIPHHYSYPTVLTVLYEVSEDAQSPRLNGKKSIFKEPVFDGDEISYCLPVDWQTTLITEGGLKYYCTDRTIGPFRLVVLKEKGRSAKDFAARILYADRDWWDPYKNLGPFPNTQVAKKALEKELKSIAEKMLEVLTK